MAIFALMMNYNTTTLSNGLRIIHLPSTSQVVYCGYQIDAGSRDEAPGEEGLAHFCEHATFKGTERRKAWNIINSLESVGGDLNAYTNKEAPTDYVAILKHHIGRAIDLLTDIVFHSVYPQAEIDKEVEVICDEIESYNDSPAELIFDEFENIIFKGHPLGHNILGTTQNVRSFNSEKALAFARKHYRPDNAIFFIYGDVEFKEVVKHIVQSFGGDTVVEVAQSKDSANGSSEAPKKPLPLKLSADNRMVQPAHNRPKKRLLANVKGNTISINKGTHQAHVMLGNRAYDIQDDRRMALYLLNNILGGPGMSARLNIVLREKNGLVYTVDSSMVSYGDTGLWCTYFGCDPHDVKRCLRLVRRELDKLMVKPISDSRLRAAKKQIKGQIGVACDNRENFALDFGKSFLHYGWEKDIAKLYENIDAITASDIQDVAKDIFDPERITTLIYQ